MPHQPDNFQDSVEKALASWRVTADSQPDFQRSVWRRISARNGDDSNIVARWVDQLTRPAVAFAVAAVTLVLASGGAIVKSRIDTDARMERLERSYVVSIDPIQKFNEGHTR